MTLVAILGLVFGLLADGSTLAKNEFNCALYALNDCRAPQLREPWIVPVVQVPKSAPLAAPRAPIPYEGLTGYANPSLNGR